MKRFDQLKKVIFVHGGPGLNSKMEETLLAPIFQSAQLNLVCWNEPDLSLSSEPYMDWKNDLESFLVNETLNQPECSIVVHSFSAVPVMQIVRELNLIVKEVVCLAPCLDLNQTFRTILGICVKDFKALQEHEKSQVIENGLMNSTRFADEAMSSVLEVATTNPLLLSHYWKESIIFQNCISVLTQPKNLPRLGQLIQVLADMGKKEISFAQPIELNTTVWIIFSDGDEVVESAATSSLAKILFPKSKVIEAKGYGHFMQFEMCDALIDILKPETTEKSISFPESIFLNEEAK